MLAESFRINPIDCFIVVLRFFRSSLPSSRRCFLFRVVFCGLWFVSDFCSMDIVACLFSWFRGFLLVECIGRGRNRRLGIFRRIRRLTRKRGVAVFAGGIRPIRVLGRPSKFSICFFFPFYADYSGCFDNFDRSTITANPNALANMTSHCCSKFGELPIMASISGFWAFSWFASRFGRWTSTHLLHFFDFSSFSIIAKSRTKFVVKLF